MKKLSLLLVMLFVTSNCYGATRLYKTVKQSGGDYTTIAACMAANDQNLVTADKYFDVEIDGAWTVADESQVSLLETDYTTDATRYINIYTTATARHNGTTNAISGNNTYRMLIDNTDQYGFYINGVPYVKIQGIEIYGESNYTRDCVYLGYGDDNPRSSYCTIAYNLFHDKKVVGAGIMISFAHYSLVYNNILYAIKSNSDGNPTEGISCYANNTGVGDIFYNNTIYNCTQGMTLNNPNTLKNNLCYGNTTYDYSINTAGTTSNNLASDATSPDNDYDSKTIAFVSTGAGTEDLHLAATDTDAIDDGADLSGIFADDIDGVTRSGTWDIGADETAGAPQGIKKGLVMRIL